MKKSLVLLLVSICSAMSLFCGFMIGNRVHENYSQTHKDLDVHLDKIDSLSRIVIDNNDLKDKDGSDAMQDLLKHYEAVDSIILNYCY